MHVRNGSAAKLRRQTTAQERIEFYATEEGLAKRAARERLHHSVPKRTADKLGCSE